MKVSRTFLALALLAGTAGCNLAPKYERPTDAIPVALPTGGAYPRAASDAPDITNVGWRDFFIDPKLKAVIETGLANNRDLRIAAANVLQSRAQYRIQRADRLPTATVSGIGSYTDTPSSGGTAGQSTDGELYTVEGGISAFEIDLFGRVRNLTRARQEQYFASEQAQRATRIALIAQIATTWLTLASDQEQLRISRQTLAAFENTLALTRAQFQNGIASELEARQADTNYQSARNDIAVLTARVAQDQNALNLLVGTTVPVEHLPTGLMEGEVTREALPADLKSDILLRRPDVLEAEHLLIAENANIGAARAAFFPQISLTAIAGTISTALSGLFDKGSYTYTGQGNAVLTLFDGGRKAGNLAFARASQQAAGATYEKTIQTAFREVSDALATRGTMGEQMSAQTMRAESARVAARLSDARYRAGVDSFLTALDSQRTAYAAEQQLVTTKLAFAANMVELYRSLGGGLE